MSTYEIKRRAFNILENIDENTTKLERKGKLFLLKHYATSSEMDRAFRINKVFITNGVQVPPVRFLNKKTNDILFDYIDGYCVLDDLQYGDLKEEIYDELFKMYWRCKQERIDLDFNPINFKFYNGKLYYMSTKYSLIENRADGQEKFLNKDLKLWFYTKEAVELLKEHGMKTEGQLEEEYATNKRMTLICVKYYK